MEETEPTGSTRMEIAQEAITGVADVLPESANMGLRAFGPGETGTDCEASDLLVPVDGPREEIVGTVDALEPSGWTPLAYSLEQAADDFTDAVGPKTIVLVSDGEETCDGDPVEVAEEMADRDIDLRIHVIGYDVDDDTRDQLIGVAQAGNGTYYDARDGAALVSRLARASEFALDPYVSTATPIDGSDDGLNPPVLEPGHYVDTKHPDTDSEQPVKYYAFDLVEDSTVHLGANIPWGSAPGVEWTSNHALTIYTDGTRDQCANVNPVRVRYNDGGHANISRSLSFAWDEDAAANECGAEGRYVVEVANSGTDISRDGPAPLELLYAIEPNVSTDELPEPFSQEGDLPRASSDSELTDVLGSNGFSEAPILNDGFYQDTIRPGEEIIYRVPVEWGERLATRVDLPDLDGELSEYLGGATSAEMTLMSPTWRNVSLDGGEYRQNHYRGDPVSLEGATAEVRYRNRFASDAPDEILAASHPGFYYLKVRMAGGADDPYFELPINLTIETIGEAQDGPDYSNASYESQPGEQLSVELAADATDDQLEGMSTSAPGRSAGFWAAVAAIVVVAGSAMAWWLTRHRNSASI